MLELQPTQVAFYDPIQTDVQGWKVSVDPVLLTDENKAVYGRAVEALANHLQRIEYIVPAERLEQLKQLPIWLELENKVLRSMQYHPGRGWLVRNGHDPRLVKHVHIPRAKALYDTHMWAKHPYVILHELAHAYHDQVLDFDNENVLRVFNSAKDSGLYDNVLLYTGKRVKHYGMTNQMEYFAEQTEAYFGVNDFYPFVRAELAEYDPACFSLMQEVWGKIQ